MKRSENKTYQKLKEKSEFFCTAKWNELYLYLNHGLTNSCHHPIPQEIPIELARINPSVLHNTPHKLKQQEMMCKGLRPKECHMCWHIEDSDPNAISDRLIKSSEDMDDIEILSPDVSHKPKFVEVVFDNVCNLSCSYCDGGQSSTWANHTKKDPLVLQTDYRDLYSKVHIKPGSTIQELNDIWLRWFPEIKDNLKTLKISGGEPLRSNNCWRFLESLDDNKHISLAINSNLVVKPASIEKILTLSKKFKNLSVAASIDAPGEIGEYARQGLDYDLFMRNCETFLNHAGDTRLGIQATINILSVFGILDLFDMQIELKGKFGSKVKEIYVTMVRFPEFQSVSVLPKTIKMSLATKLHNWKDKNFIHLSENEQHYFNKVLSYLSNDPKPLVKLSPKALQKDLSSFIKYYDKYSKKSYKEIYPESFVHWIGSL